MKMSGAMRFLDRLALKTARKSSVDTELIVIDWAEEGSLILHVDISGTPRILRYVRLKFDASMSLTDRRAAYVQFLSTLPEKKFPKVILTWSEGMTFRQLQLPSMPPEDLLKALDWDLKKKYYFNKEENLLGYQEVMAVEGEEGSERLFSVYYCENKIAIPRLDFVFGLGLQVQAVIPGPVALAHLVAVGSLPGDDKDVLVCELRENIARIVVAHGKNTMLVRNLPFVVSDGIVLDEVLGRIADEIKKTIDFYEAQKNSRPIAKLIFVGEKCEQGRILDFMTPKINLPIEIPPIDKYFSGAIDPTEREWAVSQSGCFSAAIGAALVPDDTMNLVPMDVKIKNRQGRLNRLLNLALIGFGVFLMLWTAFTGIQGNWIKSRLTSIRADHETLKAEEKVLQTLLDRSRIHRTALKGDAPLHALLKDISLRAHGSIVFKTIEFGRADDNLTLSGEVLDPKRDGSKTLSQFVASLNASPFFANVSIANQQEDEAAKSLSFEISATVKGMTV